MKGECGRDGVAWTDPTNVASIWIDTLATAVGRAPTVYNIKSLTLFPQLHTPVALAKFT